MHVGFLPAIYVKHLIHKYVGSRKQGCIELIAEVFLSWISKTFNSFSGCSALLTAEEGLSTAAQVSHLLLLMN